MLSVSFFLTLSSQIEVILIHTMTHHHFLTIAVQDLLSRSDSFGCSDSYSDSAGRAAVLSYILTEVCRQI